MGERCLRLRGFFRLCSRREIVLFRADRPLLVALIELFETLCLRRTRLQGSFHLACHPLLGGWNILIDAGGDGGEDSRPQRAALIGGDNLQRTVQHVAAGLHDDLVFPRDTAKRHDVVNRDPLLGEALHNGASAEGGGGDQTAEQRRRVGGQVKVGDHPFQALVGIRRAAAVEPVEHHRQMLQRWIVGPGFGERRQ